MKKFLKAIVPLLLAALFGVGAAIYAREFIKWENMALLYGSSALILLPFACICAFTGKSKKGVIGKFFGGLAGSAAILFGLTMVINNVIMTGDKPDVAIGISLSLLIVLTTVVLVYYYIKSKKQLNKVLCIAFTVIIAISGVFGFLAVNNMLLFFEAVFTDNKNTDPNVLHLSNHANGWDNGTPIGNGSMGAMLFGDPSCEKLYLNEESIWSDNGDVGIDEEYYDRMETIREMYLAGNIVEAEKWSIENHGPAKGIESYEYAGVLTLDFDNKSKARAYSRDLILSDSVAQVEYKKNGDIVKHEAFSSYPDKIMAYRIESESEHGFNLSYEREQLINLTVSGNYLFAECTTAIGDRPFCVGAKIETDGEISVTDKTMHISGAKDTVIWISIVTEYKYENYVDECKKCLEASEKGYDTVKQAHIDDYSALYSRSEIFFEDDSISSGMTADKRLEYLREYPNATDSQLTSLYFNFSKYLMISSSREGSLPANLQGIWVEEMENPWGSDYHLNINLQMNYWPVEVANLQECAQPLFDYMNNILLPNGKKIAETNYNARGTVAHTASDIYGYASSHGAGGMGTWNLGAAWLSYHMWERYLFTEDTAFLRDTAYEYIKNCALFFIDTMFEDENGTLISGPSMSPENSYYIGENEVTIAFSPAMDIEIIGGLLRFYIETEDILNIDAKTKKEAEAVLQKMPELQIGKNGQLMEWLEDYEEVEPGHRHISHAFALYPDNSINRDTPELYEALRKTLELRLASGGGHTGWSRAWLMCLYARFYDSDAFEENLRALFTNSTADNLLDMHPPFQIDGNFGAMAGICEALIQSQEDSISMLPAIGENRSGYFKGLLARGGYTVSADFENGKVTKCEITAEYDGEIKLELPKSQKNATINGQNADENGLFVFECSAGETYKFTVN